VGPPTLVSIGDDHIIVDAWRGAAEANVGKMAPVHIREKPQRLLDAKLRKSARITRGRSPWARTSLR